MRGAAKREPLLAACRLGLAYEKEQWLFQDVNFSLFSGEIVGIMGPSGCGKTTFGYCLSGIIPHVYHAHTTGAVTLLGEDMKKMRMADIAQKLGVVFQEPDTQLFSPVIEDEIAFGPENLCLAYEEIHQRIGDSLHTTQMQKYRYDSPKIISGGEKQLIALSAVLALNPEVLIFDEAMSQLDEEGCTLVKKVALRLKAEGKGVVLIEHNIENLNIADRILTFSWDEKMEGSLHE